MSPLSPREPSLEPFPPTPAAGLRPGRRWRHPWLMAAGVTLGLGAGVLALLPGPWSARASQAPATAATRPGPLSAAQSNAQPVAQSAVHHQAVTVYPVESRPVTRTLLVNGTLTAWDEVPVGTEATGLRVVEVAVEEGQRVVAGQVLARLNDTLLRAAAEQNAARQVRARAVIAQQEAQIAEAEATLAEARANLGRAESLRRSEALSAQNADSRRTAVLTAEARLTTARQGLALARADLALVAAEARELTERLAQTEIRAPFDGILSSRTARVGQVPQAMNAELFRLIRDGRVELVAEVPDQDLARVRPGQSVSIQPAAEGAPALTGVVDRVGPVVDAASRLGRVHVRLAEDAPVRPGQFARALISLSRAEALMVPESAVVVGELGARVFVLGEGRRVSARPVTVGTRRDGLVEILAGLALGEPVVVAGAGFIKDGDPVAVVASISAAASVAVVGR